MFETVVQLIGSYWQMFLKGAGVTLMIAALTVIFGTMLGGLICYARLSGFKPFLWLSKFAPFKWLLKSKLADFRPLNALGAIYVEIIRGTPMLLQIWIVVFGLPVLLGLEDLSKLICVIVALCMNSGAYVSELIRAGIQAVDKGQGEAARSLGMTSGMTMREIILPQAVKNILPALGNEFIMIVKDSSLGSVFFIGEIMTVSNIIKGALFMTIEPLIIAGLIYFCMTFTLSKAVGVLERRMAKGD